MKACAFTQDRQPTDEWMNLQRKTNNTIFSACGVNEEHRQILHYVRAWLRVLLKCSVSNKQQRFDFLPSNTPQYDISERNVDFTCFKVSVSAHNRVSSCSSVNALGSKNKSRSANCCVIKITAGGVLKNTVKVDKLEGKFYEKKWKNYNF